MNSTIAFFDLVQDDMKRVEQKMRETPRLPTGSWSSIVATNVGDHAPHQVLSETIDHLVASGGKRVRPALTLLVSYIYPAELKHVLALSASIELLHTATLVHDDLIDGALLRRGSPTLNATWTPGATVLTGDYLFARAADLAAQTDHVRVMRLFAQTLMVICSGEVKQMFDRRVDLDRSVYYDRIYAKTAALFAVATEAAGVLGNAPVPVVAALREYGEHLGMAFQIVDDVLDFVGDEKEIGKPVGSDLRAGLVTLPTLSFLEQRGDQGRRLVGSILNNGHRDKSAIKDVVHAIRESGAIETALDEARQFVGRSQFALQALPPGKYRDALWELSNFVVDRDR